MVVTKISSRVTIPSLIALCTISSIAAAHGKTSAQVLLRWHLQAGNIAIPGSSNEAHIQENFEIFDFELTDTEMQQIAAMDQNRRHSSY